MAEDKAEIWATLMCYQQVLHSPSLQHSSAVEKKAPVLAGPRQAARRYPDPTSRPWPREPGCAHPRAELTLRMHVSPRRQKAGILKSRAKSICSDLNDAWWHHVREVQQKQSDHWEVHSAEQGGGQFWFNWVTGERRWTKPDGTS